MPSPTEAQRAFEIRSILACEFRCSIGRRWDFDASDFPAVAECTRIEFKNLRRLWNRYNRKLSEAAVPNQQSCLKITRGVLNGELSNGEFGHIARLHLDLWLLRSWWSDLVRPLNDQFNETGIIPEFWNDAQNGWVERKYLYLLSLAQRAALEPGAISSDLAAKLTEHHELLQMELCEKSLRIQAALRTDYDAVPFTRARYANVLEFIAALERAPADDPRFYLSRAPWIVSFLAKGGHFAVGDLFVEDALAKADLDAARYIEYGWDRLDADIFAAFLNNADDVRPATILDVHLRYLGSERPLTDFQLARIKALPFDVSQAPDRQLSSAIHWLA